MTHCCLKLPWYVIHSQSLTLTSDDLIWSSCGNYYDHTSIVMKIIQKAAELWTAITGHESQHRQVNTWTWSQVITHCDLSALNIMLGSKQHLKNDQQIILLLLYCDSFMTFYQKYIFLELASYFLAKMIFWRTYYCVVRLLWCAHTCPPSSLLYFVGKVSVLEVPGRDIGQADVISVEFSQSRRRPQKDERVG